MLSRRFITSTAVLALPLTLTACGEKAPGDPRTEAPLVRVAFVQPVASASRSFTGVVAARVQSDLGFRVPGKVLERLVDAGQTVKRGQPLIMRAVLRCQLDERGRNRCELEVPRSRARMG